ncbi:MAG: GAF domain-containing protein [Anaerolineae bacterium]|nr:GAF domain-containing protein [Anaerolineae bacterium]
MTDLSSLTLQNQLLTREVKRRVDQLAAINTVAATVGQSLDLDVTLDTALDVVLQIVEAEAGGISLIDEEAQEVVLRAQRGWARNLEERPMRIPFGKGMTGRVLRSNKAVLDNNLDGSEELAVPSFLEEDFRSIVMAPMHARGRVIGILSIMSSKPNSFEPDIIGVLEAIADTVGVALHNAQLYEATLENQNNLKAILDSTTDGIIATDQKGRIRHINEQAERMFAFWRTELVKTPLREIPIDPHVRDLLLRALETRSGEQESFEVTFETGQTVSITASPVHYEKQVEQNSETDGWVIVFRDVTHRRTAELARAQYIAAAAHDMRSPLGVTINSLKLLDTMIEATDETVSELLILAQNGVDRLQALIDDVLRLEQIEAGYGVEPEEVDVVSLLREACHQMQAVVMANKIQLTLDLEDNLPRVQLDRQLISRAVINYLDNAAKYIDENGHIILRAFVKGPMLHIEVTDDGPGIPPQEQTRLFERFYRAPMTRAVPGTGLGLAIVKSIARAVGGDVYVRSTPGQGSTFGITARITPP